MFEKHKMTKVNSFVDIVYAGFYDKIFSRKFVEGNETLRAHMYKKHQISRMFMCRCCNWAFPDKTSLHIHMQAMANGNPGNVSIIAKSLSSTLAHGGALVKEEMGLAEDSVNNLSCPNMPLMDRTPNSQESGVASPATASSIFPNLNVRDDVINRLRERAMIGNFVGHPSAAPVGAGGLDIASLFPNFAKLNSNFFSSSPNFHRGGVPTTTSSSASPSTNNFAEFMQNAAAMKAAVAAAAACGGGRRGSWYVVAADEPEFSGHVARSTFRVVCERTRKFVHSVGRATTEQGLGQRIGQSKWRNV
uniref:C2H2-type domain-containing protein n=1 Tax=Romanomermis culicivorax TaxID=13658 RepID=A0A915IKE3_ROMCU